MMKKLGMVITCLVMILLLVSCANKRNDLVLSNFPSIQNELTEKDLLKAVGTPHEKSSCGNKWYHYRLLRLQIKRR